MQRESHRQIDGETDRRIDGQTDRETAAHTYIHTQAERARLVSDRLACIKQRKVK